MSLILTSTAFIEGGAIPKKYTCEGDDISPPLSWSGVPSGTQSFVLIADDPDAPDPKAPRMTYVHWVLFDLPADTRQLGEAATALPAGTRSGLNDWKRLGYGGPCPPIGRHRYFFKLYALDKILGDFPAPAKPKVEQAMQGHILETSVLMGTYEKTKR